MDLQVLVATMHQNDDKLIKKMNLQSDAIIINQADYHSYDEVNTNGNKIQIYSFAEKGVGLSRNNAFMRATAKYALLADDDMVYVDNYSSIVKEQFEKYPQADIIIFNLEEEESTRYIIKKTFQVSKRNYMRFGAARVSFKPDSIKKKGISFHLLFGGGTPHSNGEDTIFLHDCLEKGLTIMAVPVTIAKLTEERDSTWFTGYTEKYYRDRGALFKMLSPKFYQMLIIQYVVRKYKNGQGMPSRWQQLRFMIDGAKDI